MPSTYVFLLRPRPPPTSTLFPYTTLFRSDLTLSIKATDKVTATGKIEKGKEEGDLTITTEKGVKADRSEEHTSELQSLTNLVCRLLLEKKKKRKKQKIQQEKKTKNETTIQ